MGNEYLNRVSTEAQINRYFTAKGNLRYCSFAAENFWRRYLQRREPLRREAEQIYSRDALRASLINPCLILPC